ncbi:MAG: hypothetical protein CSA83_00995 [Actinomycetales bacterium]|nr:MAG: hypothetical protein CSA83_00995 [Actinomycetales bacterium]
MAPSCKVDPLVYALTGEQIPASNTTIQTRLAQIGWNSADIAKFRDDRLAAGLSWPLAVEPEMVVSMAAFAAELMAARSQLGLVGPVSPPSRRRALNADEKRLIADRPPHWG